MTTASLPAAHGAREQHDTTATGPRHRAERTPEPQPGTRPAAAERLDIVPLLAAYQGALRLARRPPASLALPKPFEHLHRWLRPRLGCHYFVTRHVLRRTAVLERALEARTAMGRGDDDDRAALETLRSFRASLSPSLPRAWLLAALITTVVVSQALVGWLLQVVSDSETNGKPSALSETVKNFSLSLDVRSINDVVRALTSANFVELGVVVMSVVAVVYLFGRPLGFGFRLAQLCLDRRPRMCRRRRRSPLCSQAARLGVAAHERTIASVADVSFRRELPIDLMVKAAVWFAMGYVIVGCARFLDVPGMAATRVAAWLVACAAVLAGLGWSVRRVKLLRARGMGIVRLLLAAGGLALASRLTLGPFADALADPFGYIWLALLALTLTRLACLARRTSGSAERALCFALPFALIVAVGIVVRYDPDAGASESALHGYALESASVDELPQVKRADLQVLLASRHDLSGADLRTQDLHDLSLRAKDLTDAQLMLANLDRADLAGASLLRADLRAVTAAGATLRGADLRGADLRCSNLEGADLRHARLSGVDWDGVVADGATRWPKGFDHRHRGMTERGRHADTWYSSDYSFNGYLAYECLF
jgi:hypothetical protein